MKDEDVESICVFGSTARSSADGISDRDILVVSSDCLKRKLLVHEWKSKGWSVACYSPNRLMKMISSGSLFIQHLKLEGIILKDKHRWLERALQAAEKKNTYEADANGSVALVLPIERFTSESLIQENLIVSDLAYVALRNFGICFLADKGKMVFDYHTVVQYLGQAFGLSTDETTLIHSLREGKADYRERCCRCVVPGTVEELRSVLSKLFIHHPLKQIQFDSPVRDLGNGYATLRDFEAAVFNGIQQYKQLEITDTLGLERAFSMISNPRKYAWDIRNLAQEHLESMRRKIMALRKKEIKISDAKTEWMSHEPI